MDDHEKLYVPQNVIESCSKSSHSGENDGERATVAAAISWSGGKDCHLAFWRAWREESVRVVALVVFGPPTMKEKFRAHPLRLMREQAKAIGLPLLEMIVDTNASSTQTSASTTASKTVDTDKEGIQKESTASSYREQYVHCLRKLQSSAYGNIQVIYTGDMDYVGTMDYNWMTECCKDCGMKCELPLWKADRQACLQELWDNQFHVIYSCVKSPWFDASWIGRTLDATAMSDMQKTNEKILEQQKNNNDSSSSSNNNHSDVDNITSTAATKKQEMLLDLGGENGEFHTMALDGPMYKYGLTLNLKKDESKTEMIAEELKGCPGQKYQERWWVLSKNLEYS